MALGQNNSAIYLNIADGKIVRQFREATAHSIQRITKTGKVVHEEFYDYVEGLIAAIETKKNDYGKFWMITITDNGDRYVLQFNYSGGTASAFLKTLPNVDLSRSVKIIPKQTIEGDKKKSTVFLNQGGTAMKWFWNKDNSGDLPQLKKVKVKGKEQWDDSDMMEFLENYIRVNIQPKLAGLPAVAVEDDEEAPF
jgi:hypothetical protein